MSQRRGKPYLSIRMEPEVLALLKERVPPGERGRGGGVSHYVRQLIYADLGLGEPPRFAPELSPRKLRARSKPRDSRAVAGKG